MNEKRTIPDDVVKQIYEIKSRRSIETLEQAIEWKKIHDRFADEIPLACNDSRAELVNSAIDSYTALEHKQARAAWHMIVHRLVAVELSRFKNSKTSWSLDLSHNKQQLVRACLDASVLLGVRLPRWLERPLCRTVWLERAGELAGKNRRKIPGAQLTLGQFYQTWLSRKACGQFADSRNMRFCNTVQIVSKVQDFSVGSINHHSHQVEKIFESFDLQLESLATPGLMVVFGVKLEKILKELELHNNQMANMPKGCQDISSKVRC